MVKKILIAVGGSGGHVFPAISLAQKLMAQNPQLTIVFAGGGLAENKFIDRRNFRTVDIPCGRVITRNPWRMLFGAAEMCKGVLHSRSLLKDFAPDLVVGFGSYHSFPLLAAAKLSGCPYVLHAADSVPGKVVRLFSRWALMTGIHFPAAAAFLKGYTVKVGIPLRENYYKHVISKEKACTYYGLDPSRPVVLVFGGSQGARKLNSLMVDALDYLPEKTDWQFLHLTGDTSRVPEIEAKYSDKGIQACVKGFETSMEIAWCASTMALTRAGAGTIAEMIEFEVPGILIPYPHASEQHQDHNARYVVDHIRGAVMAQEATLTGKKLAELLTQSLHPDRLQQQVSALAKHKQSQEHGDFSKLVLKML